MSSSKNWDLEIDPSVFRALKRMPRRDAEVLLAVIRLVPANPFFGDIRKMKGEDNAWRRRVGSYRVLYRVKFTEKVILVFRLERRTSSTY